MYFFIKDFQWIFMNPQKIVMKNTIELLLSHFSFCAIWRELLPNYGASNQTY